jgi:DNA uptake protein ComE-like DNA-binding protein
MIYSDAERQKIIEYLKIKPIHHGQLEVHQIYVPPEQQANPSVSHQEVINYFQANLHPILVRRTNQYGEDQEYELIYGGAWYQAAKSAGLQRVWVWVFDLTDAQVAEVKNLLRQSELSPPADTPPTMPEQQLPQGLEKQLAAHLEKLTERWAQRLEQVVDSKAVVDQAKLADLEVKVQAICERLFPLKKNIHQVSVEELQRHRNRYVRDNAEAIVAFIQKHAPLSSLEDLRQVKGVGKGTVKYLAEHYTV